MTEDQRRAQERKRLFRRAIRQNNMTATTWLLQGFGQCTKSAVYRIVAEMRDEGEAIATIRAGWHMGEWVPETYYTRPRNPEEWALYRAQRDNEAARRRARDEAQQPMADALFSGQMDQEIGELLTRAAV